MRASELRQFLETFAEGVHQIQLNVVTFGLAGCALTLIFARMFESLTPIGIYRRET